MRAAIIGVAIAFVSVSAQAQQTAQDPAETMKIFVSSADVAALAAKAKSERKEGQGMVFQPIFKLAPWDVNLEYRAAVASANVHEREAELFYVIDGSGTMVVGGKLLNEKRTNPENRAYSADVERRIRGSGTRIPTKWNARRSAATIGQPVTSISVATGCRYPTRDLV